MPPDGRAFKGLCTVLKAEARLPIQLGVYATGEHRAKSGNPDQLPEDLKVQEWLAANWAQPEMPPHYNPSTRRRI
jgi:hypothetical protein